MMTDTKQQIYDFIKKNKQASPRQITDFLKISSQAVHRQLKKLIGDKQIVKMGTSPRVYYKIVESVKYKINFEIDQKTQNFYTENYLYINPQGQIIHGDEGFKAWVEINKQTHLIHKLSDEYIQTRQRYNQYFDSKIKMIEASEKFKITFADCQLDFIYYSDFYSLPKFGKTLLGNLVLYAKQAQNIKLIGEVAEHISQSLVKLIKFQKIDAIVWTPHSLPRKIPFLNQIKKNLNLELPEIVFLKAYSGEIPIPQKSLSKLEERIDNAENTIYPKENHFNYKRVLIFDDAVGSGATLQAIAGKLKKINPKVVTVGYAIVGSLKGFEVIKEV